MHKKVAQCFIFLAASVCFVPSGIAQRYNSPPKDDVQIDDLQQSSPVSAIAETSTIERGHLASTGSGEVGQRQAIPRRGPLNRLQGRIANRVQNRIRNRLDRYYSPQANANSPFLVASEQVRTTGRK